MTLKTSTLSNGMRVVTDTVTEVESVAIGIWADVGTRHEDLAHNGVAHMVEHMMFNGTPTRNSQQIAEAIENVGGQVNAYTSREVTAYYVHLLKEDMPMALDVLGDILQHPIFPDKELEKERDVILQEIGMTNDTPDDIVFDHYQATAYPGQALGASILGTADIVANMKKDTLFDYVRRFYTPQKLVLSAAGHIHHDDLVARAEKIFVDLPPNTDPEFEPARYVGGERREEKDLEQSHVVLGFQGVKRGDIDYFPAMLLSTILGGGMSSRLFQEVREKRGLVYAVYASHGSYHDDGQFEIYAGTGPEKLPELMPVLCNEIKKMATGSVTEMELSRAKAQIRSGILMSRESMMSRAGRQAKNLINYNKLPNVADIVRKVEAVEPGDIRRCANRIFAGTPTLSALGPLKTLESYDNILKRL
ncbi:MAG: insulinase family protein [Alphaproteobacteria bacterium]|nr:insulinase family protein [Alphaproteobacteria bacterium]